MRQPSSRPSEPAAIIWATAQVYAMLPVTRNTRIFPPTIRLDDLKIDWR
jgi:hypothetical protein